MHISPFQPSGGDRGLRSVTETREKAVNQLIQGHQQKSISKRQTDSGVKDGEVMYWLSDSGLKALSSLSEISPEDGLKRINPYLNLDGSFD